MVVGQRPPDLPVPPGPWTRSPSGAAATTRSAPPSRGIGPAYADKARRVGLRAQDLLDAQIFREQLDAGAQGAQRRELAKVVQPAARARRRRDRRRSLGELATRLAPVRHRHGQPAPRRARRAASTCCSRGRRPPSSTSTTARIRSSPRRTRSPAAPAPAPASGRATSTASVGVAKAYVTRVGAGPFPTELLDERRRRRSSSGGHEYGTITGRRRRAGWFDAVMLRHAVRLNSLTELALTKLDVLDGLRRGEGLRRPTRSTASGSPTWPTTSTAHSLPAGTTPDVRCHDCLLKKLVSDSLTAARRAERYPAGAYKEKRHDLIKGAAQRYKRVADCRRSHLSEKPAKQGQILAAHFFAAGVKAGSSGLTGSAR